MCYSLGTRIKHGCRCRIFSMLLPCILLTALAGCATVDYSAFEYRHGSKIIEGDGGSKRMVEGVEIWDSGDPPHRYRILGITRVVEYDQMFMSSTMLHAIAQQVKKADGNAAVLLNEDGDVRGNRDGLIWDGQLASDLGNGYMVLRALIVQYLPDMPPSSHDKPVKETAAH